ncbi:MAG: hypothetical protein U0T74_03110 [Chitinophagales bacterium]
MLIGPMTMAFTVWLAMSAEWTSSAFYENSYSFIHDLNPDIRYDAEKSEPEAMK